MTQICARCRAVIQQGEGYKQSFDFETVCRACYSPTGRSITWMYFDEYGPWPGKEGL